MLTDLLLHSYYSQALDLLFLAIASKKVQTKLLSLISRGDFGVPKGREEDG